MSTEDLTRKQILERRVELCQNRIKWLNIQIDRLQGHMRDLGESVKLEHSLLKDAQKDLDVILNEEFAEKTEELTEAFGEMDKAGFGLE